MCNKSDRQPWPKAPYVRTVQSAIYGLILRTSAQVAEPLTIPKHHNTRESSCNMSRQSVKLSTPFGVKAKTQDDPSSSLRFQYRMLLPLVAYEYMSSAAGNIARF
eukprot:682295-Pleurochrysis_carterae.AAC.1